MENRIFEIIAKKAINSKDPDYFDYFKRRIREDTEQSPHLVTKWLYNKRQPSFPEKKLIAEILEEDITAVFPDTEKANA